MGEKEFLKDLKILSKENKSINKIMPEKYSFKNIEEDKGKRLDRYLREKLPQFSRTFIQKIIKERKVLINKKIEEKTGYLIKGGERIKVSIPETLIEVKSENIPLQIIFEDEDILVINKRAGMVISPDCHHQKGTLVSALMFYLDKNQEDIEKNFLVHRLDKGTSGLMIIGKNKASALFLKDQFKKRKVLKKYFALLLGKITPKEAIIEAEISRDKKEPFKMAIVPDNEGKKAISYYKVLEYLNNFSLVEVWPKTGRTHQIRVHFASLGHPIIGDDIYGGDFSKNLLKRLFLHAFYLEFRHPRTRKKAKFEIPLPSKLLNFLEKTRKNKLAKNRN